MSGAPFARLSALPRWRRLALVCVGFSALLHGMALDWWRGINGPKTLSGEDGRPVALQARLHEQSAEALSSPAVVAPLRRQVPAQAPSRQPVADGRSQKPDRQASAGMGPENHSLPVADAAPSGESGLRPLSPAEGLVAYRLAILAALRVPQIVPTGSLRLVLVSGSGGLEGRVDIGSGDAVVDVLWLGAFREAAAHAALPSVLAGRDFELALELAP